MNELHDTSINDTSTNDGVTPRQRSARRSERTDSERGAALVEFSIVFLVLLTLIFSTIELSLAWGDTLILDQSSRGGARVGAQLTNDPNADREALRAAVASLNAEDLDQVEYIVIYRAAADGSMDPACETGSTATCNYYPVAALADLDDDARWGCGAGTHDDAWCPTARDPQITSPVDLGLHIKGRRSWITGSLPGGGIDISSETVMRLDPLVR